MEEQIVGEVEVTEAKERGLVIYPNKLLRFKCEPVLDFNQIIHGQLDEMHDALKKYRGFGLAAPQLGITFQAVVIRLGNLFNVDVTDYPVIENSSGNIKMELVNPKILEYGKTKISSPETCLSIPGYHEIVERSSEVRISYQTRTGESKEFTARNFLAVVLQHEIQHLDGILYIDQVSQLKRQLFNRWYQKKARMVKRYIKAAKRVR